MKPIMIGKTEVFPGLLAWTDQFWPHYKYNRRALGLRYRDVWTWDCNKPESQLQTAPKTFPVECSTNTDMLTPMGRVDRSGSRTRLQTMQQKTGLSGRVALDKAVTAAFGSADVPIPYDKLKLHFTKYQRIKVRAWISYGFLVLYAAKNSLKPNPIIGPPIAMVSYPMSVTFEPFLVGRCNVEVAKPVPRKPLDRFDVIPVMKGKNVDMLGDNSIGSFQYAMAMTYGGDPQKGGPEYPPPKDIKKRQRAEERLWDWRKLPKVQ